MQQFDLIVIGTGSAGKSVAEKVREAGRSVAIIDKMPFGGTCSQRGCDPKKILVGAAEIVARAAQLTERGIDAVPQIDWPALMAFKKTFTESIPERTEKSLAEAGITAFHGAAVFESPKTIRVGEALLGAEKFVIATGASPMVLNIPGEHHLIDSTGFLELKALPSSLVLVGGGYIAFEFAHIAARAGARVTIVHQGKAPLEGFDPDLVGLLVRATEAAGIEVQLEAKVTEVKADGGRFSVLFRKNGREQSLDTELVIHAAGRPADIQDLALEKAEVAYSKKGVAISPFLQSTTNPAVYACGDAAEKGLPLTPVASYEAGIVAENLLNGNQKQISDIAVPSTVFTLPPLAAVGMSEKAAKESGRRVKTTFGETTDWYTSKRINEPVSGYKMLIDEESGLILGAHLLGSGSDELINLLTLAINHRIPAEAVRKTLYAYPTHGSDLSYMLD